MGDLTRRGALALGVGAALAPLLPSGPAVAGGPPLWPAWGVGTPGEWDGAFFHAPNAEAAKRAWAISKWGAIDEEEIEEIIGGLNATQVPNGALGIQGDEYVASTADNRAIDWGICCDECGNETDSDDYYIVGERGVCQECVRASPKLYAMCDPEGFIDDLDDNDDWLDDPNALCPLFIGADHG